MAIDVMKFAILIAAMLLCASPLSAQTPAVVAAVPNDENAAHYGWAAVLRVDPVYDEASADNSATPQQECWEEQVPVGAESGANSDSGGRRAVATMIGAVVGGLLGNQVGKGDGRRAATVAGAVAGGVVGNQVGSDNRPQYTTQRRCRPSTGSSPGPRHVVAYDVEYRYRGEVFTSRLTYDPGDRMRVKVSVTPAE
jgi:uncharacterized protein YcfJ